MKNNVDLTTTWGRIKAWFYAMFIEHNIINYLRLNFHAISDEAYRSAQPTPSQIRKYVKKHNIKTIINLKGKNPKGPYWEFEKETCDELGIPIVNVGIKSRGIPNKDQIREAKEIFESIEYPIWMHCKAGSDRTGIYANLYQYFKLGIDIKDTNQLAFWPYGHIKQSKAGQVDFYFDKFVEYQEQYPQTEFFDWTQTIANKKELENEFHTSKLADFINDKILRRQ